jgi:hypothetical protein
MADAPRSGPHLREIICLKLGKEGRRSLAGKREGSPNWGSSNSMLLWEHPEYAETEPSGSVPEPISGRRGNLA